MDELVQHLNELRLNCVQKQQQQQQQRQQCSPTNNAHHSPPHHRNQHHNHRNHQQLIDSRNDQRMVTINAIRRYAKVSIRQYTVLDVTWTHESELTAQSFRGEHVNKKVNTIIFLLDSIYQLCEEMSDIDVRINDLTTDSIDSIADDSISGGDIENPVKTILGLEFAECLLWRKASLIYAFCASHVSDYDRDHNTNTGMASSSSSSSSGGNEELRDEDSRYKFLTHLIDAIQWFKDMLTLRQPFIDRQLDKDMSLSEDTLSLVENNVHSDNHLLAMMYLSEMVFWYYKYSNSWHLFLHMEFDAHRLAKHCLTVYITAVDKCLNKIGWNCERAKQLLTIFSPDSAAPTDTSFSTTDQFNFF